MPYDIEVIDAKQVAVRKFLRLLVMAPPKVGKTSAVLMTSPRPIYVINSDGPDALDPATELCLERKLSLKFKQSIVQSDAKMDAAIGTARELVKKEGTKTIVWDTMTNYSKFILEQCKKATLTKQGAEDGRKFWPLYHSKMEAVIDRLFSIDAHVVVISHYEENSSDQDLDEEKKGTPKFGEGIVPMLGGKSRKRIGGMFPDVVFVEKKSAKEIKESGSEDRVFVTDMEGVWGPGCRSLPGVKSTPADIGAFLKMKEERMKKLMRGLRDG
jgi:AAA domain